MIKNVKNNVLWTCVINDLKKLLEYFMKNELRKTNQIEFRTKKAIQRKGDKLC